MRNVSQKYVFANPTKARLTFVWESTVKSISGSSSSRSNELTCNREVASYAFLSQRF